MKKILEREELLIPTDEEIDSLANQAEAVMNTKTLEAVRSATGYTPPEIENRKKEVEQKIKDSKKILGKTLNSLGIKPFTQKSVEKYQKKKSRSWYQIMDLGISEDVDFNCVLIGLGGFIYNILVMGGYGYITFGGFGCLFAIVPIVALVLNWGNDTFNPISSTLISLPASLFFGVFGSSTYIWNKVPLDSKYKKDVPLAALEKVADISRICPSAEFFIEELIERPDPFLVVQLENEEYYIDVWEEPDFNGEIIA